MRWLGAVFCCLFFAAQAQECASPCYDEPLSPLRRCSTSPTQLLQDKMRKMGRAEFEMLRLSPQLVALEEGGTASSSDSSSGQSTPELGNWWGRLSPVEKSDAFRDVAMELGRMVVSLAHALPDESRESKLTALLKQAKQDAKKQSERAARAEAEVTRLLSENKTLKSTIRRLQERLAPSSEESSSEESEENSSSDRE